MLAGQAGEAAEEAAPGARLLRAGSPMTQAGGRGSAPPGAPCLRTPLRPAPNGRGVTAPALSHPRRSGPCPRSACCHSPPRRATPPPVPGHPCSRRTCLPGTGTERVQRMSHGARHRARTRCPSSRRAAPQLAATASPQRCSVLGDAETAQHPLLGVRRNQCHFCPLVFFPCRQDPYGSGQKEFRKKLARCREMRGRLGVGLQAGEEGWQEAANSDA